MESERQIDLSCESKWALNGFSQNAYREIMVRGISNSLDLPMIGSDAGAAARPKSWAKGPESVSVRLAPASLGQDEPEHSQKAA